MEDEKPLTQGEQDELKFKELGLKLGTPVRIKPEKGTTNSLSSLGWRIHAFDFVKRLIKLMRYHKMGIAPDEETIGFDDVDRLSKK